jgi:hypothetical protein
LTGFIALSVSPAKRGKGEKNPEDPVNPVEIKKRFQSSN